MYHTKIINWKTLYWRYSWFEII